MRTFITASLLTATLGCAPFMEKDQWDVPSGDVDTSAYVEKAKFKDLKKKYAECEITNAELTEKIKAYENQKPPEPEIDPEARIRAPYQRILSELETEDYAGHLQILGAMGTAIKEYRDSLNEQKDVPKEKTSTEAEQPKQ